MQKDLKIGMVSGLVLVAATAVWLSTRPSLSTKARMLTSNSRGCLQETQPFASAPNQPQATNNEQRATNNEQRATRLHIIRKGETLSDISYKYYGSANKWQKILDANRKTIKDPNRLRPGTKLIIPE